MTREEALRELMDIRDEATAYPDAVCYVTSEDEDALNMAIEALNREQQIIENGYKGKEMRIRIGGKLFAVRELAQ